MVEETTAARGLSPETRVTVEGDGQAQRQQQQAADTAETLRGSADMYSFNQGSRGRKPPEKTDQKDGPPAPEDPYSRHQGPRDKRAPGDKQQPGDGKVDVSKLPQTAKLESTLYDMAEKTLRERSKVSKEKVNKDAIYHELNRIMVLNGYDKSNLDGRHNLNDHMLRKSWNSVQKNQEFKLYGDPVQRKPEKKHEEPPKKEKPDPAKDKTPKPGKDAPKPGKEPGTERSAETLPKLPKPGNDAPQRIPTREEFKALAAKTIDEQTTLPPLKKGENYSDMVKARNPQLSQEQVFSEAKRLKDINGEPNGQPVKLLSPDQRETAIQQSLARYDAAMKQRADEEQARITKAARDKAAAEQEALDKDAAQRKAAADKAAAAERDAAAQRRAAQPQPGEKKPIEAQAP